MSPSTHLISVVIADDHAMFREGLATLLRLQGDFGVVAVVGDGESALAACRNFQPTILLADLSMPGMDGLETIRKALEEDVCGRAVLLTMHKHPSIADDSKKAGAAGYVLKEEAFEELADVLRAVAAGEDFVEPAGLLRNAGESPALSPREKSVLALIVEGLITKEIADRLKLSDKTVETFRDRLMKKTGARNVADLVRFAHETGLVR